MSDGLIPKLHKSPCSNTTIWSPTRSRPAVLQRLWQGCHTALTPLPFELHKTIAAIAKIGSEWSKGFCSALTKMKITWIKFCNKKSAWFTIRSQHVLLLNLDICGGLGCLGSSVPVAYFQLDSGTNTQSVFCLRQQLSSLRVFMFMWLLSSGVNRQFLITIQYDVDSFNDSTIP